MMASGLGLRLNISIRVQTLDSSLGSKCMCVIFRASVQLTSNVRPQSVNVITASDCYIQPVTTLP